jgi:hypothetical protein
MSQEFEAMKYRYEQLKRMYFRTRSSSYDDDDSEVPVMDRQAIVQMFNNMGVELPLTPNDPMVLVRR